MSSWPTHSVRSAGLRHWPQTVLALLANPRTWLVVAWVLTMISIPIIRWVVGDGVLHWGVIASVLLQAAAVMAAAQAGWGTREMGRVLALVLPLAWLVEWTGSTTGFPFGARSAQGWRLSASVCISSQAGFVPDIHQSASAAEVRLHGMS